MMKKAKATNNMFSVRLSRISATLSLLLCSVSIISLSSNLQAQSSTFKRPNIAKYGPYVNSDILTSDGLHTVVPKHAILFTPERLAHRKVAKPTGRFVIWPNFLSKNYGWIYKYEVTLDQASGKTPITEEQMLKIKSLGKVVVAVYKNGPISVLPPKTQSE